MNSPLRIVVVGHTNTGKTSLLRTLARDETFGEVRDQPATTRQAETLSLVLADGTVAVYLVDTPGLEDARGLLECMEEWPDRSRIDGPERLERLLQDTNVLKFFDQEIKVLQQILQADAAIYVADSREPLLGKYREELMILGDCAIPLLPVLNFVSSPETRVQEWRAQMRRLGLHAVVAFDTVVFNRDDEQRLFDKLRTLLDSHSDIVSALMEDRKQQGDWLHHAAAEQLADLLINAAAFVRRIPRSLDATTRDAQIAIHQACVRQFEQETVDGLLRLFDFDLQQAPKDRLPLVNGRWGMDLFHPDAFSHYGIRAGKGAVAGAMTGLAVDFMTLGGSLGTGTMTGSVIGSVLGGTLPLRRRLWASAQGFAEWRLSDETLLLLFFRQQNLIQALLHRGHAAQEPVQRSGRKTVEDTSLPATFWKPLRKARLREQWSRWNVEVFDPAGSERAIAVKTLAAMLRERWNKPR